MEKVLVQFNFSNIQWMRNNSKDEIFILKCDINKPISAFTIGLQLGAKIKQTRIFTKNEIQVWFR